MCAECSGEIHPERKMRPVQLDACSSCRRIQLRGTWKETSLDDAVQDAVQRALKGKHVKKISFSKDQIAWGPGRTQEIPILAEIKTEKTHEIPLYLSITICPACGRQGGQYFEGVLQLRNPSPEAINRLYAHVSALADRGVFINKEVKQKKGIDFYLTSQKHLQTIAKRIQKEFGGTLSVAAQLFSWDKQTSKDIYRVNALLTLPAFMKGDVIVLHGRPMHITNVGRSVSGIDVATRKKVSIESTRIHDKDILKKRRAKVLAIYPEPTILHPDTFEQIALIVHEPVKKDQNVKIILWKEKAYLL